MKECDVEDVLRRVLMSGRLGAGAKLGEAKLAALFGVSRERVRAALKRLSHDRLVQIERNRGAFAIQVDLGDARAIYEARRILESGIMLRLVECASVADLARLRRHVTLEAALRGGRDRSAAVRLAGEFHLLMAQMVGNQMIVRQLQELIGRSTSLVTLFESEFAGSCSCAEHKLVVDAIEERDPTGAVRAMTSHLSLIETRLRPRVCEGLGTSLDVAIGEELRRFRSERVLMRRAS